MTSMILPEGGQIWWAAVPACPVAGHGTCVYNAKLDIWVCPGAEEYAPCWYTIANDRIDWTYAGWAGRTLLVAIDTRPEAA